MTSVQIFRHGGEYRSFRCCGHTGFAEAGEDIVCAGVSAIVINTVNCLQDLLQEKVEVQYDKEDGDIVCNFLSAPGERAAFLLDCMIHGLKWIQSQYGTQYLNYEIREV